MANKVISYNPQPYGDYQLGFCTVDIGGKCEMILKVLRSRQGNVYCAFNSVGYNGAWFACFTYKDKDQERDFLSGCLEQVKKLMAVQEDQPAQVEQIQPAPKPEEPDGMPF